MPVRMSAWRKGPKGEHALYLRALLVSLVGVKCPNGNLASQPSESGMVGIRLDFESTQGRANLVIEAGKHLPGSIALLRRLRDACDIAIKEIERE